MILIAIIVLLKVINIMLLR